MPRPFLTAMLALAVMVVSPALAQEKAGLLTVITSPDPQTQLMALTLTGASVRQGARAEVLLCGKAADMALRDAPPETTAPQPPRSMSVRGLMTRLMEAGVPVAVCAIYLPGLGAGPEVLLEGVGTAMPPAMAAAILDPGVEVLGF